MKNDYLKSMFDAMKALGKLTEYKDYEDFKQKKYGAQKEDFRETLKEDEKKEWDIMFNEGVHK